MTAYQIHKESKRGASVCVAVGSKKVAVVEAEVGKDGNEREGARDSAGMIKGRKKWGRRKEEPAQWRADENWKKESGKKKCEMEVEEKYEGKNGGGRRRGGQAGREQEKKERMMGGGKEDM